MGPLAADPSITVEIRAGGPCIGFQPTTALMYSDDSILLGYVNTDEQIATFADQPTVARRPGRRPRGTDRRPQHC